MTAPRSNLAVSTQRHTAWAERPARMNGNGIPASDPAYLSGNALDAYIAGCLTTAYALSEHLSPFKLRVDVKDAVVTLSGAVDDKVLRNLAIVIAHDLEQVRDVRSEITIEAPAPHRSALEENIFSRRFNDATLTARVKTRLLWNGPTHGSAIHVSASNDVVTLTGSVQSNEVREMAEQIALDVKGVLRIENNLQVAAGAQPPE
jgi:osmotically-inducible protein OsmY